MELTFGEKIKQARKLKGLTQKQLAEKIDAKHNSVSDWENNKNKPDPDTIELLCGILELTPNYLLSASPDVFSPSEKLIIKKYRSLDPYGQETVNYILDREYTRTSELNKKDSRIKELETINALPPAPRRIYTYLHKIAAAGVGFYFDDIPTDTIEAPYRENADFIVGVNGDSMEPTYSNGDLVYVEKCQIVEPGEIGIFIVNNECFIKEAGHDELISHNKKYKPIPGTEHIICVGRVLGKVNTDETAPAF